MSCSKSIVYVVVSEDRKKIVAHNNDGWMEWADALPWTRSLKFKNIRAARHCAEYFDGQVMSWIGFTQEQRRKNTE